jgi:protein-disulfide isomerase
MMRALTLITIVSITAFGGTSDQISGLTPSGEDAVAEVDGVKLTFDALERDQPSALFQARNAFYEARRKAVDELVTNYLLKRQAKKENVSVAELLERHVDRTIAPDPNEEALRVYYEGLDTNETFEAVKPKIIEHIREKRMAHAKESYLQSLRADARISVLLAPPRAEVTVAHTPTRGPANAPVVLVEYADYECPYCQQAQPDIDKLETEFKGKMAFVYKDLPLPMHPHAQKAAEAAQCAGVQNKYWEYHDLLLKSRQLEVPQLKQDARELGLDGKSFDACLDSGQQSEPIKANLEEAKNLGLQGTPSFFLNGRFFSGNLGYEKLREMVAEELKRKSEAAAGQK